MTDHDIINALECCTGFSEGGCTICPLCSKEYCREALMGYSRNLINRLQAEIERWQEQCEMNRIALAYATGATAEQAEEIKNEVLASVEYNIEKIKSEAREEFAELITDKASVVQINSFDYAYQITEEQIDNLLEEINEKENV